MSTLNSIIEQINDLTGYQLATASFVYTGSAPVGSTVYVVPPVITSGTIPTTGIYPGGIIEAQHLLRIINALNGVSPNLIIMSGSLQVTGSANFSSSLVLPFVPDQNFIESNSGSMEGTGTVDGGSF